MCLHHKTEYPFDFVLSSFLRLPLLNDNDHYALDSTTAIHSIDLNDYELDSSAHMTLDLDHPHFFFRTFHVLPYQPSYLRL